MTTVDLLLKGLAVHHQQSGINLVKLPMPMPMNTCGNKCADGDENSKGGVWKGEQGQKLRQQLGMAQSGMDQIWRKPHWWNNTPRS
jgi:hypothetical protein